MNNSDLNNLLKEYETTRLNNIYDSENRKKELYLSNPRLQEIDDNLAKLSIDTAKLILKNKYIKFRKKRIESERVRNSSKFYGKSSFLMEGCHKIYVNFLRSSA